MSTELKKRLSVIMDSPSVQIKDKLLKICQLLDHEIEYYNWTGFYFSHENKDELLLGPFVGAATDHTVIPFGKGICGQVAVSGQTFVVPDVQIQDNYLSCSVETKAEIVVPIIKEGKIIGQIDIDSHQVDPFTQDDRALLEWLCEELAKIL
jgi:GAF domain-containing protein